MDDWELEQGDGVAFYWTTPLPMTLDASARCVVIEGRRGRAMLSYPDDCEASIDYLPLMTDQQRLIDRQRADMEMFVYPHADTQPRLAITQRGKKGTLVVRVRLETKA